jgi:hypothetical protein
VAFEEDLERSRMLDSCLLRGAGDSLTTFRE